MPPTGIHRREHPSLIRSYSRAHGVLGTKEFISTIVAADKTTQQEAEKRTALTLPELFGQSFDLFFLVEIGWYGMGFTLTQRIELFDCLVTRFCVARRDVDCGAIGHISLRDHSTDAFCAAGDQDDFTLQGTRRHVRS